MSNLTAPEPAALQIRNLQAWYGSAHVLQGIDLTVGGPPLAIVGRNGMGKTTLCQSLTGLLGPDSHGRTQGSMRVAGTECLGHVPYKVARAGVAYVPQGRRVFGSLSVDEHLRIVRRKSPAWTPDRVYDIFPRLKERRRNGGHELSGGEQQMLAIGRALLTGPTFLIMDEPSEGLAPAIAWQLAETIRELARTEGLNVLVVEQNLNIAAAVADTVAVMVSGRIVATMPTEQLRADADAQRRWLGVG